MVFVVEFVVDLDNMPNQIQNIYVCALMIPLLSMTRPTHETFLVEDAWRARALKRISGGRS